MKTAISVPDEVFREIDKVAKERHSSRSEVIVTAVREYLERRKSRELLNALNEACGRAETAEEYEVRKKVRKRYGSVLRKERPKKSFVERGETHGKSAEKIHRDICER